MNVHLVADGELGVGALVVDLATTYGFPVTGIAAPSCEAEVARVGGLVTYVGIGSGDADRVRRLNIVGSAATLLVVSKLTPRYERLLRFTQTLQRRPAAAPVDKPARPCLVIYCDDETQTTEDIACEISQFLRKHSPASVYVCGSVDIQRRSRLVAAMCAGLKSAASFG